MAPDDAEVLSAARILRTAQAADWAPINDSGSLHDRASYRYFWHVLERARATGKSLPPEVLHWFA